MGAEHRRFAFARVVGLALAGTVLSAGCGGASESTTPAEGMMVSERLIACDTLSRELREVDPQQTSDDELTRLMHAADAGVEPCGRAYLEASQTAGEAHIARHRRRQLMLQALLVESVLTQRLDEGAAICPVLADTFALLLEGLGEIEIALGDDTLSEAERTQLLDLRNLDLEAVDILVVTNDEQCE